MSNVNNYDSHSVATKEQLEQFKALPEIEWSDLNFNGHSVNTKVDGKIRMVTNIPNPIKHVVTDAFDAEDEFGRLTCYIELALMIVEHKGKLHQVKGLADVQVEQAKGIRRLIPEVINATKDENGRSKFYPNLIDSLDPKQVELNGRESYVYRLVSIMKKMGNFNERNAY